MDVPGATSGESKNSETTYRKHQKHKFLPPAANDLLEFQLFSSWKVQLVSAGKENLNLGNAL